MTKRRKTGEAVSQKERDFIEEGSVRKKKPPKSEGETLVNGRVPSSIADRLNQAYADRRVSGEEPSKMKEILAAALDLWLTKNGY